MSAITGTHRIIVTLAFDVPVGVPPQQWGERIANNLSLGAAVLMSYQGMGMQVQPVAPLLRDQP